jgi:hypothetical protein
MVTAIASAVSFPYRRLITASAISIPAEIPDEVTN